MAKLKHHKLILYVIGASPNSMRAVDNIKNICETHLKGAYDLGAADDGTSTVGKVAAVTIKTDNRGYVGYFESTYKTGP